MFKSLMNIFLFVCSFSVAQATTNKFIGGIIPEGTPTIDGVISDNEWKNTGRYTRHKFFGEDSLLVYFLMWDSQYLYIAAEVSDYELWIDDFNASQPWVSTFDDDAVKWEFDVNSSRDSLLQDGDRVFAINADGSASRFDKGNGSGSTVGAELINNLITSVKFSGSINDQTFKTVTETSRDNGYVVEAAISWQNLYGDASAQAPTDGTTIGINITTIEDDTGGSLDPSYHREWKRVYDEISRFMGEEGRPEFWAEFVFAKQADSRAPSAVTGLTANNARARSVWLDFTATGDNGSTGFASNYDIRISNTALSDSNWAQATVYNNSFRPKKSGEKESLHILGLTPSSTYFIGLKAVDENGVSSPLSAVQFNTSSAATSDKGFLTVCPGMRYFCREDKTPHIVIGDNQGVAWPKIRTFYNGQMWDQSFGRYRNYFAEEGVSQGRAYLQKLSDNGVNTIRLILESYDLTNPVYLFEDVSGGASNIRFNQDMLGFLTRFVSETEKVGISLILTPFDTFYYKDRWHKIPFSTAQGGPLASANDLFKAANYPYLEAILGKLNDIVGNSKNILAIELLNEFDSDDAEFGWNTSSFAEREATVQHLADYYRTINDRKHMVFVSSVRWDPSFTNNVPSADLSSAPGADSAIVLNNDSMSFNSTHMYYHDIRDPNLNQSGNTTGPSFSYQVSDVNNTISPAVRVKQGIQYYIANALRPKPYLDTESGPITFFTQTYDRFFSQADDEQYFHNMIWAHLAAGGAGTGLRWPGEMLSDHALTDTMRSYQKVLSRFVQAHLDFSTYTPESISDDIDVTSNVTPVVAIGSGDQQRGIVFLVKDERSAFFGNVSNASMTIKGLSPVSKYTFEFWNSYNTSARFATSQLVATPDANGTVTISVPTFANTLSIKFYTSGTAELSTGYFVTDELWIRAVIDTVEKGPVEALWVKGGEASTDRGDRVIWGYFHANSSDVTWGSEQNPDLYVKIWFDVSGRVDVTYFHVSVPDITVYTDYQFDGSVDEQSVTTLDKRYVRHYFQDGTSGSETQTETGTPVAGEFPARNPVPNMTINDLDIGATINTDDVGQIDAVWRFGGSDSTARGDEVIWGFFYASPADVGWGSSNNPEVFVKIWFDAGGRIDVNFFHVSVPDIEVASDYPSNASYDQKSISKVAKRYIRHLYQR